MKTTAEKRALYRARSEAGRSQPEAMIDLLDDLKESLVALRNLFNSVSEQLEVLDSCGEDCSDFHDLTLDFMPAAQRVLEDAE